MITISSAIKISMVSVTNIAIQILTNIAATLLGPAYAIMVGDTSICNTNDVPVREMVLIVYVKSFFKRVYVTI